MGETEGTASAIETMSHVVPRHSIRLRHRIGALHVDAEFVLTQPWTVLFGPSGSGKTTVLRAIAGLLRPDHARIVSTMFPGTNEERSFTLVDTDKGLFLPPHKRVVRLAAQQESLFPHLTVLENLTYGMKLFARDAGELEVRDRLIDGLLTDFYISGLTNKFPEELSGGEAQRVVLARTVAATGRRLMMLDEPFTGLDLNLRDALVSNLLRRQKYPYSGQVLSVTHDVAEAFQLGAEVIQIADGRVVQQGPVEVVLAEERDRLLRQLGFTDGVEGSSEPYLSG